MEALRRALAVQAAVAHDLNNELTIILSALQDAVSDLEPNDPIRPLLLEARGSAQRCAWKVSGILNYCNRSGVGTVRASAEHLMNHYTRRHYMAGKQDIEGPTEGQLFKPGSARELPTKVYPDSSKLGTTEKGKGTSISGPCDDCPGGNGTYHK